MLKDIIQVEALTEEENEALAEAIENNTDDFVTLKFVEEVAELQEKLIKFHLKDKDHKPKMKDILDEIGDTILRMFLWIERQQKTTDFDISEYLGERIDKKLVKMHGYVKEGKYKGGL